MKTTKIYAVLDPRSNECIAIADEAAEQYKSDDLHTFEFTYEPARPKHIIAATSALNQLTSLYLVNGVVGDAEAYTLARAVQLVKECVKTWDFTASTGETLPVTQENLEGELTEQTEEAVWMLQAFAPLADVERRRMTDALAMIAARAGSLV